MSNTIFITANWTTGALSQQTISRQYDNNRYAVQFIGYPEGDGTEELDLYLLVWMSTAPGQKPGEITPIQLNSDQWYISNYFTQQVQVIKFQLCVLNEAGTYEAHSPIFSGRIGDSLEHNGTSHDIDVSTLFDAYREYLNELIIGAGAVIIDPVPTQGSTNAVSSGGVYDALQSTGLPENAKVALLSCFRHVAWTDEHGQDYYDALESALYADQYPKITATFNSGTNTIYTDDELNTLKQYLTVKYYANAGDSGTTIPANNYTLSGVLTAGTSTIIVAYNDLTTAFTINGVVDFYNIWNWSTEYDDVGALEKVNSFVDAKRDSQRRGFYTNSTQNNRFGIAVSKGKQAAIEYSTSVATDKYPIPIPKTAVKVTVSVTPATDYLFCYLGRYEQGIDSSGYDYEMVNEAASWTHQGTYTCEFTAGENLFLGYNGKKSDNSAYTDADRAERVVTVTFE